MDHHTLLERTAEVAAAWASNNPVAVAELGPAIAAIGAALAGVGQPEPEETKPTPAANPRKSVKPDHIVSLIDGRPYRMLKRHLGLHGYTPDSYREAFGLPRDYPMVAPEYAERRRELAKAMGLGRKRTPTRSGRARKSA